MTRDQWFKIDDIIIIQHTFIFVLASIPENIYGIKKRVTVRCLCYFFELEFIFDKVQVVNKKWVQFLTREKKNFNRYKSLVIF